MYSTNCPGLLSPAMITNQGAHMRYGNRYNHNFYETRIFGVRFNPLNLKKCSTAPYTEVNREITGVEFYAYAVLMRIVLLEPKTP